MTSFLRIKSWFLQDNFSNFTYKQLLKFYNFQEFYFFHLCNKLIQLKLIEFRREGIFCPKGNFYIDPWFPVDYAVITHAHADHARWGMKHYLCQNFTKPLLQSRISPEISIQSLNYGETIDINGVKVSFHPAGHIIGSSQVRLEYKGFVTVISGDYKVDDDGISTPFELVKCNEFVTESTFGLPIYNWKKNDDINRDIQNWVVENQKQNKTSVFIGYSLGKSQRLMKALDGISEIFVHSSIHYLNEAIQSTGIVLPKTEILELGDDRKKLQNQVVLVPPALLGSNMIKKIPNGATAICSGWMQVRGRRRWKSADAGFAISDHADWNGLLQTVKGTEAEKIYVTHGSTDIFSKYLNEIGIKAEVVKTKFGEEEEGDDNIEPGNKEE